MLSSLYRTDDLDIVLIFLEPRSIFNQESCKIQGGQIEYHLFLPPFKVESIELLGLLLWRNINMPGSVHHWCLGNENGCKTRENFNFSEKWQDSKLLE